MRRLVPPVLALLLALAACSAEPATTGTPGHTHAGGAHVSLPVGDGTRSSEVGYTLADVDLPDRAGVVGEVSFRIDGFQGTPVTDYLEEQTKDLHLYVVREDLAVFRHLHPTLDDAGSWSAPVSLPSSGDYRVVAEFVARDPGGNGDHVILGHTVPVAGGPAEAPAVEPVLQVEVTESPAVGPEGRLRLRVRDEQDRPVRLGTYLGTYGHVTGFHEVSGAMVHLHPLGPPETTENGAELTFHTEIEQAGDYRLFVQVRVDGYLHMVPVPLTVSAAA
ncbi:MAG TPA: hypothetical protein VD814_09955 [Nocardioides sp.]|nr:hypothetical protein [Nocardioides sp.]